MTEIQQILFNHQDKQYGDFVAKLVPTVPRNAFIGIRSPEYKKILKELDSLDKKIIEDFINTLPHEYQEENCLQVALINNTKDYDLCLKRLKDFLPYINNWTISDSLRPKAFEKNKDKLYPEVKLWINDNKPYTIRVGLLLAMKFYLEDSFNTELLDLASQIRNEEYYVNMMIAWLFAEALTKQWDIAIHYIQNNALAPWTHNKAIQKAIESFRITEEQKTYLRTLKVKVSKDQQIKKP